MVLHLPGEGEEQKRQFRAVQEHFVGILAESVLTWEGIKGVAGLARATGGSIAGVASRVGIKAFAREWKWARLAIPLQTRLAAEQGLWDLGDEY